MSLPRDEEWPESGDRPPLQAPQESPAKPDDAGTPVEGALTVQFVPAQSAEPAPESNSAEARTIIASTGAEVPPKPAAADPPSLALNVPDELYKHPRYKIVSVVGGGGMGMVYQAEHRLMDRPVALKVIHPRYLANPSAVERFRREVQAAARLHHPNIVTAFDAEQAGGTHFLIMEFVQGQTLADYLRHKGKLDIAEACDAVRQAALGLEHAHHHKMVHRDIKPDNLMRSTTGEVKILDFGLARFAQEEGIYLPPAPAPGSIPDTMVRETGTDTQIQELGVAGHEVESDQLTAVGSVMGTPDYMAPEQIVNTHTADARSDIYALGCTLYQLLTGQVPFPGGNAQDKMRQQVEGKPRTVRQLRPDVPAALALIVEKMMAKDPAQRYATPREAGKALEPFCKKDDPRRRLRRRLVGAALALFLLGAVVGGAFYWQKTNFGMLQLEAEVKEVVVAVARADSRDIVFERVFLTTGVGEVALPPGDYVLTLADGRAGLRLIPDKISIDRGRIGHVVVLKTVPDKATEDWVTLPAPDAKALTRRASIFDALPGRELPDGMTALDLRAPMELVAVLGGTKYRLAGPGSVPGFSAKGDAVAVGSGSDILLLDVETGAVRRVFRGHDQLIEQCALSPDGKWLASSGRDNTIRLWDAETGREVESWFKNPGPVAFSLDSRLLAFEQSGQLHLRDLHTGLTDTFRLDGQASALAFHPNGDWLGIGLTKGAAALFSPRTKTFFPKLAFLKRAGGERIRVAFDAAGERFAVGSSGEIEVYGTPGEKDDALKTQWSALIPGDGMLAFSDGILYAARLVHGSAEFVSVARLEAATGKPAGPSLSVAQGTGTTAGLALSPDGRWIGACLLSDGRTLQLFDVLNRRRHKGDEGHTAAVSGIAFYPDGKRLLSIGADRTLREWNLTTLASTKAWNTWAYPYRLAISPDGKKTATTFLDKTLRFWTPKGFTTTLRHTTIPQSLAFDADNRTLYLGGNDGRVLATDLATLKDREAYATTTVDVEGLTLDRTGKFLAAAGLAGQIHIWQAGSARQVRLLPGHSTDVFPEPTGVRALACSADNRFLFSTGRDGSVRVWDWETGKRLHLLHGLTAEGTTLAPSPDGRLLAVGGSDGQILLWDMTLPRPRRLILRHASGSSRDSPVAGLAFSPEGRYLAAGLGDGTIQIIRLAGPGIVVDLSTAPMGLSLEETLPAPEGVVDWRLFPDGESVVSVHKDATLHHWNLTTGRELSPPRGVKPFVTALAVAPDAKTVWTLGPAFKFAHRLQRWDVARWEPEQTSQSQGFVLALNGLGQTLVRERDGCRVLDSRGEELLNVNPAPRAVGALSQDGRWAMLGLSERTAVLIDLPAKKTVRRFPIEGGKPHFTFSPDSKLVAWVSGRESVTVYDLDAEKELPPLAIANPFVREMAIAPDQRFLALGNLQGMLMLYDLSTGKRVEIVRTTPLVRAAFTPDSERLITSHLLGQPRIWRVPR